MDWFKCHHRAGASWISGLSVCWECLIMWRPCHSVTHTFMSHMTQDSWLSEQSRRQSACTRISAISWSESSLQHEPSYCRVVSTANCRRPGWVLPLGVFICTSLTAISVLSVPIVKVAQGGERALLGRLLCGRGKCSDEDTDATQIASCQRYDLIFSLQHYDVFFQVAGVFSIFRPTACTNRLDPYSCRLAYGTAPFRPDDEDDVPSIFSSDSASEDTQPSTKLSHCNRDVIIAHGNGRFTIDNFLSFEN